MKIEERQLARLATLRELGASAEDAQVLLAYNENPFQVPTSQVRIPLPDEPFVETWSGYAERVRATGTICSLAPFLVQLRFPIEEGISQTLSYREATQHGRFETGPYGSPGLQLSAPEACSVEMYPSHAGSIATITAGDREDFVRLVQALGRKNEPEPLPPSMGALMIAGYRNWHRVHAIQKNNDPTTAREILQDRSRFQDRFILLSRTDYSGVTPSQIGMGASSWREASWLIRREHEVAHYFCRRVLGVMRNNLLDEILADYCGIVRAHGCFRAEWMLLFFGLEHYPAYRTGARLENYRGDLPVDSHACLVLQRLVYQAALALEAFSRELPPANAAEWPAVLMAIATLTLEEIAGGDGLPLLRAAFARALPLVVLQPQPEEVLS